MMQRGENGVTLIELAVVMAIIAIMSVFRAPAVGEGLDNYRLRQAAREVSSDLQFAKMKAISTGRYCTVAFNITVDGTQYSYVVFPDYDNDLVLDTADAGDLDGDGDQENETTDIFKMVSINNSYRHVAIDTSKDGDGITFTNNRVAFDAKGFPRSGFGNGSVHLINSSNNKGRSVVVSRAGRIKIEE